MKRSKLIFVIVAVLFILGMILATIQMASQTTPPWKKKKEILKKYDVNP